MHQAHELEKLSKAHVQWTKVHKDSPYS